MSGTTEPETTIVDIGELRLDGGTQSRAKLCEATIAEYAEQYSSKTLPPIVVFYDGSEHWLADGFHRVHGAKKAGRSLLPAEVRQGSQRDAVLYSVGANATHGLPRTNADKRRAVELLLRDEEWSKRSDRWIAEKCGVSHNFVNVNRRALSSDDNASSTRTAKDGREYPAQRKAPEAAPIQPQEREAKEEEPEESPVEVRVDETPVAPEPREHWWDCPVCSANFHAESAKNQGWVDRGFCASCEGGKKEAAPPRPAPSLAHLRAIHDARNADLDLASWIDVQKQLLHQIPSKEMRAAIFVLQGGDMALLRLGLSWGCSGDDLKKAFRDAVRVAHPDRGGSPQEFMEIQKSRDLVAELIGAEA